MRDCDSCLATGFANHPWSIRVKAFPKLFREYSKLKADLSYPAGMAGLIGKESELKR